MNTTPRLWGFDNESIYYQAENGQTLCLQDHPDLFEQVARLCAERLGSVDSQPVEVPQPRRRGSMRPAKRIIPPVQAMVYNEDCISGMRDRLKDESVSLVVTSPPFEELFTYSGKVADVGNNGSTIDVREGRFALNLRFVIEQLFRVLRPGCNACIHIQQLLAYRVQHGFSGRRDFRGAVIDLFRAAGFNYVAETVFPPVPILTCDLVRETLDACEGNNGLLTSILARLLGIHPPSEVAIWKDPQVAAQRLNLHSLQFKTGWARSSTAWAPMVNDYILVFQKPGDVRHPVRPLVHAKNPGGWLSQEDWILWARGTWDIDPMDILDGARSRRTMDSLREAEHEKHVCALQREVIRRCILLYTNPADIQPDVLVLDPFMGIGSVAVGCVEQGRHAIGFELKESYHAASLDYIRKAQQGLATQTRQADLFSTLTPEDGAA